MATRRGEMKHSLYKNGWWNLSPFWPWLKWLGRQRDTQKSGFRSSRYWNEHSHFYGLCGELVFALEMGLEIDDRLLLHGDNEDFSTEGGLSFDVKTCTYIHDPHLKHPEGFHKWSDVFVLVGLNTNSKAAKIVGYALESQMREAPIKDYGHGRQHSLKPKELTQSPKALQLLVRHGVEDLNDVPIITV